MQRTLVGAIVVLAVSATAAITPGVAQGRRPLTLVALAELPRLLDPQLSPDGRAVVYTLMRADWRANRQVGHLWRQAVAGGPPEQLTNGEAGESGARWSPDGRSILFVAARDGIAQVHVLPADGGEARQLTRHATSVSQAAWAPDGSGVYFVAGDARTAEDLERERLRDDVYAFEEHVTHRHLWKADLADGRGRKLTDGPSSVIAYRPSRDGRMIVLHRAPTTLADAAARSEVWVMDADGGNARALTSNAVEETDAELSPDHAQVLFLADANARFEPYYGSTLFLTPAGGGSPTHLLPGFPHAIERAAWSSDGTAIFAVANMGVHSEIFRIDVASRRATAVTDGRHSIQFWSVAPAAGRMVFQLDEETRLGDAWTLPFDGAAAPTRVTGIYDRLATDFDLPRQEKVTWQGADGVAIEGIFFYPAGYVVGRRYPLVVQLHGGPHESDKFGFGPGVIVNYVPVLTARGYAVLRPNYRGSSGYGPAFLRDVVGGTSGTCTSTCSPAWMPSSPAASRLLIGWPSWAGARVATSRTSWSPSRRVSGRPPRRLARPTGRRSSRRRTRA